MTDSRSPREAAPGQDDGRPTVEPAPRPAGDASVEPIRLPPLLPRRQNPWLIVEVDGSPSAHGALVWALREAARRDATVVAVGVPTEEQGGRFGGGAAQALAQRVAAEHLEARVLRAIAETGVRDRVRTAVLDRAVLDALTAATRGADLVVVGPRTKTLLRQAVPRPIARRLARGA